MKPFRWMGAGLLWLLAGIVGLLGVILCVTVILLPLGIPLLMVARRLGRSAVQLALPREVRHPVSEAGRSTSRLAGRTRKGLRGIADTGGDFVADAKPAKRAKRLRHSIEKKTGRRNRLGLKTP